MLIYLKNKKKLTKIAVLILLLICIITFSIAILHAVTVNAASVPYAIDYIPIEKVEIFAENNTTAIESGSSVKLCVNLTPSYAVETAQEITYEIINTDGKRLAVIEGDILTAKTDISVGGIVNVEAKVDGILSYNVLEIVVSKATGIATYVPVNSVSLEKKQSAGLVCENTEYQLTDVFYAQIYPSNATAQSVAYEIIEGREYAQIRGDKLVVNDKLKAGNLSIKVQALSSGITSAAVDIGLYVPAKEINLTVDNKEPMSSKTIGEKVTVTANTIGISTKNEPTFIIEQGESSIENISYNKNSITFNVKRDLISDKSPEKAIIIVAKQDGIEIREDIAIYIPVENFIQNPNSVSRIEQNKLSVTSENAWDWVSYTYTYPGKTPVTISNSAVGNSKTAATLLIKTLSDKWPVNINPFVNIISIYECAPAGTTIKMTYKALDKLGDTGITYEKVFTVSPLDNSTNLFKTSYGGAVSTTTQFSLIYGNDSNKVAVAITSADKQLEAGYYTDIGIKYNGRPLSDYGISSYSLIKQSGNMSVGTGAPSGYVRLNMNSSATNGEKIIFFIRVYDGKKADGSDNYYDLPLQELYAFKRCNENNISVINLTLTTETTDLFSRVSVSGLVVDKNNVSFKIQSGSNYSLNTNGVLTALSNTSASLSVVIMITVKQSYNGKGTSVSKNFGFTRRFINHRDHLKNLENSSDTWYLVRSINLGCTETNQWEPIEGFSGTLYGQSYSISGMRIDIPATQYTSEQYFGLFGKLKGNVDSIFLTNIIISSTATHNGSWVNVGGIAGYLGNAKTISNCYVTGSITVHRSIARIGGIVGYNWFGTVAYCSNWATIFSNGDTGGIVGVNGTVCNIKYCNNYGNITYYYAITARSIGGIVGYVYKSASSSIVYNQNCGFIDTAITLSKDAAMGGIIGSNNNTFSTTNINYGGWSVEGKKNLIGTINTLKYCFANFDGSVGRQAG